MCIDGIASITTTMMTMITPHHRWCDRSPHPRRHDHPAADDADHPTGRRRHHAGDRHHGRSGPGGLDTYVPPVVGVTTIVITSIVIKGSFAGMRNTFRDVDLPAPGGHPCLGGVAGAARSRPPKRLKNGL